MAELSFIKKVAERAQVSEEEAVALTEATLGTLGVRLSGGEAADVADRVPEPFRPLLIKVQENPVPFSFDEFVGRVAARAGVADDAARRAVSAVLQAMHTTVGQREFDEFMAQLPKEFGQVAHVTPGHR
jgi:uncharacterized protein (DUF2267 family)